MNQWQEAISARDIPAEDIPEVLALVLAHLNVVLMREATPDYVSYELQPRIQSDRDEWAIKNAALEHAAQMCEQRACSSGDTGSPSGMARQCAADIRSLQGKPAK